jgi:hypothetical protein
VLALVEGPIAPLDSIIIDPNFQSGISVDDVVKIRIISLVASPQISGIGSALGKEFYLIVPASSSADSEVPPGNTAVIDLQGCDLYDGWPNFMCATRISTPTQSVISSSSLVVSWQGQNGATISLTGGELDPFAGSSTLILHFAVKSGYGEFCPSSLTSYGLGLVTDEKGDSIHPSQVEAMPCVGPNATTSADVFWNFISTSTMVTIEVENQGGAQQTFFNLYPLPDGTLFVQNAPN